ncbi:hypothetical protein LWI28_019247 [Acer negundo]|uniref:Uncharacterized protein n=1 Tax=Acer negundo TaxID=4023 RepID=A0AAD5IKA3_ACENE|nr:hypothetical protein LWI28_019247 [Acer negundo]
MIELARGGEVPAIQGAGEVQDEASINGTKDLVVKDHGMDVGKDQDARGSRAWADEASALFTSDNAL